MEVIIYQKGEVIILELIINCLKDKISIIKELGLTIEIEEFCRGCKEIKNYKISIVEDLSYEIIINLKESNERVAKRIFTSFIHFIEYSAITFYTKNITRENIEYLLVSANQEMKGFICKVIFKY